MKEWQRVQLGSVASIEKRTVQPDEIDPEIKYIGLENIEPGGALVNVTSAGNAQLTSPKTTFNKECVLFGKLRPYLAKIARPEFSGICSTDIIPITPGENLDRGYLAHFLAQPSTVSLATSRATGANLPRLSPKELLNFEIPLPSINEQRRIAAVLDKVDSLRTKRREAIALLDNLTQSVFLDMFGDPRRNTKYWTRVSLGELIDNGPQNGLYKPAGKYGKGTPIVRIDAFYDGVINNPSSLKRVELKADEINRYRLYPNDILINRVNSLEYLGKCALVPPLPEPTVFESNMMRFSLKRDLVEPGYLVQFLQTRYVKSQIMSAAKNAANQSSINQRDVRGIQVSIPPIFKQRDYLSRVSAITSLKEAHRTHLAHLDELFASLQQRAFRGELFSSEAA